MEAAKKNEVWTYEDMQKLDDDNRYELYDGKLVMLASPKVKHQRIAIKLSTKIYLFFEGKTCEPFVAPMDVDLFSDEKFILQPDLFVVCDPNKITEKNIKGAPDLVIEILSDSTAKRDMRDKMFLYRDAGVKEYIIIDPEGEAIQNICFFDDTTKPARLEMYSKESNDKSFATIYPGLEINLDEIFE